MEAATGNPINVLSKKIFAKFQETDHVRHFASLSRHERNSTNKLFVLFTQQEKY